MLVSWTKQAINDTVNLCFIIAGCSAGGIPSQLEEKGETTSSHSLMAQLHV